MGTTVVPSRPVVSPLASVLAVGEAAGGADVVGVVHDAKRQRHRVQSRLDGARGGHVLLVGDVVDGEGARQAGRDADRDLPGRRGRRVVRGDRRRLARRDGERR